ncbi:MAG TPA: hypothetical protein DCR96_06880 [Hyphomonas sp.]|jgi:hypothetical protein|nr:hypothetical protein [Hyphomonadaceae bacterium]MBG53627.1 hypothetical protein [Rhodobiaceae bacterium]HAQ76199.1 hypothetical protein [Hyphomonas sp.]|tara:strand:- start:2106 stop:2546 length:441 start_codon:yes stop_codon:yes gene_type:complete
MKAISMLKHQFVGEIPGKLSAGILYISLEFDTMAHLCCCGCGHEIVTPLSPTDWRFTYNGAAITVHPSIGNWSHQCRSHYIIRNGRVVWAGDWTDEQVAAGRARDRAAKAVQFGNTPTPLEVKGVDSEPPKTRGAIARLWRWMTRR